MSGVLQTTDVSQEERAPGPLLVGPVVPVCWVKVPCPEQTGMVGHPIAWLYTELQAKDLEMTRLSGLWGGAWQLAGYKSNGSSYCLLPPGGTMTRQPDSYQRETVLRVAQVQMAFSLSGPPLLKLKG